MKIRILISSFLLCLWCFAHGQNKELENKLKTYFAHLPILQSTDSIIKYAQSDTIIHNYFSHYKIEFYPDSIYSAKIPIAIYSCYFLKDSIYDYRERIFYNLNYDTTNLNTAYFGIQNGTGKLWKAKAHYRKLKRSFSKYFARSFSEKSSSSLIGGESESTYFYLNKEDTSPFMEIYWHSGACLVPAGYGIDVYKKD